MKRNLLITSIVIIVIGLITVWIGGSLSTITESGIVQDSALMPIGAILFALGLLALVVATLWYLIGFIIRKTCKNHR